MVGRWPFAAIEPDLPGGLAKLKPSQAELYSVHGCGKAIMISRRNFIRSSLCVGAGLVVGTAGYTTFAQDQTGAIVLERVTTRIPNLPSAFEGYKIGFLTDIHLGMWLPNEWVVRALEMLAEQAVDLLVLGGDYIFLNDNSLWRKAGIVRNHALAEYSPRKAIPQIYTTLGGILGQFSFPDGTIGVPGNHDHWNSTSLFLSIFGSLPGVELLVNRERVISRKDHSLRIFGVDDFLTGIPSAPPSNDLRIGHDARIIVSHNPDYISFLTSSQPDYPFHLALCGHTHGGQIRLPYIGAVMSQIRDARFVAGMVHVGEKLVYTSRGLGVVGLPIRIDCPPEVTVFTLERA